MSRIRKELRHNDFIFRKSSGEEPVCQRIRCKRCRFDPWVGKISWRRKWQPTRIFWPGKAHGQRSLVGYSPQGLKQSDTTEAAEQVVPGLGCWVDTFVHLISECLLCARHWVLIVDLIVNTAGEVSARGVYRLAG